MLFFEGETKEEICNLTAYESPYTKDFIEELRKTLLNLFLRNDEIFVSFVHCRTTFKDKIFDIDFRVHLKWSHNDRCIAVGAINWNNETKKMTINT